MCTERLLQFQAACHDCPGAAAHLKIPQTEQNWLSRSLADLSLDAGYSDQAHMTNQGGRLFGLFAGGVVQISRMHPAPGRVLHAFKRAVRRSSELVGARVSESYKTPKSRPITLIPGSQIIARRREDVATETELAGHGQGLGFLFTHREFYPSGYETGNAEPQGICPGRGIN